VLTAIGACNRHLHSRQVDFGCNVPAELFPTSTARTVVLNARRVVTAFAMGAVLIQTFGSDMGPETQGKSRPGAPDLHQRPSRTHIFAAE
jgi:hypothetical protein